MLDPSSSAFVPVILGLVMLSIVAPAALVRAVIRAVNVGGMPVFVDRADPHALAVAWDHR